MPETVILMGDEVEDIKLVTVIAALCGGALLFMSGFLLGCGFVLSFLL